MLSLRDAQAQANAPPLAQEPVRGLRGPDTAATRLEAPDRRAQLLVYPVVEVGQDHFEERDAMSDEEQSRRFELQRKQDAAGERSEWAGRVFQAFRSAYPDEQELIQSLIEEELRNRFQQSVAKKCRYISCEHCEFIIQYGGTPHISMTPQWWAKKMPSLEFAGRDKQREIWTHNITVEIPPHLPERVLARFGFKREPRTRRVTVPCPASAIIQHFRLEPLPQIGGVNAGAYPAARETPYGDPSVPNSPSVKKEFQNE